MKCFLFTATLLLLAGCNASGLDADGEPIPLAQYAVVNGAIQNGVALDHIDQWQRFKQLIPGRYHPEIVLFLPIDSEATDGIDGSIGPVNDSRTRWSLMLDTTGAVPLAELDRTMIHELAHLLTLRLSQVPNSGAYCNTTLSIDEGCPL